MRLAGLRLHAQHCGHGNGENEDAGAQKDGQAKPAERCTREWRTAGGDELDGNQRQEDAELSQHRPIGADGLRRHELHQLRDNRAKADCPDRQDHQGTADPLRIGQQEADQGQPEDIGADEVAGVEQAKQLGIQRQFAGAVNRCAQG